MRLVRHSHYALFMAVAVIDAFSAVLIAVAGEVPNLALFLGIINLTAGLIAFIWLWLCWRIVFTKSALLALWEQHRHGEHRKVLRRRLILAAAGRLDWIFFALALAIGSPLVAVVIVAGGWPIAHALKLRRVAVSDGEEDRYHKMNSTWAFAAGCSMLGLALCLFVSANHTGDIAAWRWLAGALSAAAALYTSHWNVYGMRWFARMQFPPEQSGLRSDYRLAILAAALGSFLSGGIATAIGIWGSKSPEHLAIALSTGILIGLGIILYRVGLGAVSSLKGLIAFHFTPALSTLMLLGLGLDSVGNLGLFGLGLLLLIGGNVWSKLSERNDDMGGQSGGGGHPGVATSPRQTQGT